jgi:hypothetical protein
MKTEHKAKVTTAEEFDARVDAGEDVFDVADIDVIRRTTIDFPDSMLKKLDAQAQKRGVTRQSLIKTWLFERLEKVDSYKENIIAVDLGESLANGYVVVSLADLPRLRNEITHSEKWRSSGSKVIRDPAQGTFVTRKGDSKVRSGGMATRIRRSKKSAEKAS